MILWLFEINLHKFNISIVINLFKNQYFQKLSGINIKDIMMSSTRISE